VALALGRFYAGCQVVLSPTIASDARLAALGVPPARIVRWDRGVDLERFGAHLRRPGALPGALNVLYAGRLSREKGVELLADAFLAARARDPRLHLVLAGGGPEERALRERLGSYATFLGWLGDAELARAYASAEVFIFASRTDTFGQVVLEAQASGLPVLAVGEGGPASLIEDGRTGLLRAATVEALSAGLAERAGAPALRQRLARDGLAAVRRRSWKAALDRLAGGYRIALAQAGRRPRRRAA
jgi:glycosyltransferase involved in cell wall biosynthesis